MIEGVSPSIDCGRFRAKAVATETVEVFADIYRDGPEVLRAVIRYRGPSATRWSEAPMTHLGNDRWSGAFTPTTPGRWRYTIEAWTDRFATWRRDFEKKAEAGQDVDLELQEGALLIEAAAAKGPAKQKKQLAAAAATLRKGTDDERTAAALDEALLDTMTKVGPREGSSTLKPVLELQVDRERGLYGAWYEMFPRSSGKPGEHGSFETAIAELPRIAELGFDVVYLPPIHPIGNAHRKGKNNTLAAKKGDVGVPWAIGSADGGHKSVHPDLGTIEDFDAFVKEAEGLGLEVALDFAIQCSPDHPWVKDHPEWFNHRPDGSIKYAENPPKKYQDVYPVNFDTPNADELWRELKGVLDFWISHGVKIFRVDNPHTKPFAFWEWVIGEIQKEDPDVIFLAEAFTRPKVMQQLAKLGFTQSYTYFTWRNSKEELVEYLTELSTTEMADYFRPNFFANTPDILHEFLQLGGPPAFKIRLVLAALTSPSYGLYSGFELFEGVPREPGSEEYLDSEKYELKHRDFTQEPNLNDSIARINQIRRDFPVCKKLTNIRFHQTDKDRVLAFSKTGEGQEPLLVVVNLNPFHWEETTIELDLEVLGIDGADPFEVHDLLSGETFTWQGRWNYVRLDPREEVAHIFHVRR